ncbi:DUF1062 domain-containing protein [Dysgonomonas sp. ZJ279]|uniref:DUF1062 domain-containing protein n=1 Tax=Dysgonomonas sp. ZJ279 TaxID=2709796 RepID=UPI0013EBE6C7|nr:DUF1062 domain-containing protein [Dysgonomonas sp. ZJ279]
MKNFAKNIKQNNPEGLTKNTKTVSQFTWEIIPTSTPLFKRKCSKCKSSNLYYSSDKFRLNSQKRSIDVWLIYKCVKCDNTCNITILSRTRPELIDRELYRKFSDNDEETAWIYAFDAETIRRNSMELDYSNIEYDIVREDVTLKDMIVMDVDLIEFEIKATFNLNLRLTHVIRKCFDISLNQLEKMLEAGVITVLPLGPVKKSKVKDGITVIIHREKLKKYLEKEDVK